MLEQQLGTDDGVGVTVADMPPRLQPDSPARKADTPDKAPLEALKGSAAPSQALRDGTAGKASDKRPQLGMTPDRCALNSYSSVVSCSILERYPILSFWLGEGRS